MVGKSRAYVLATLHDLLTNPLGKFREVACCFSVSGGQHCPAPARSCPCFANPPPLSPRIGDSPHFSTCLKNRWMCAEDYSSLGYLAIAGDPRPVSRKRDRAGSRIHRFGDSSVRGGLCRVPHWHSLAAAACSALGHRHPAYQGPGRQFPEPLPEATIPQATRPQRRRKGRGNSGKSQNSF
jgi:hypothetical protein